MYLQMSMNKEERAAAGEMVCVCVVHARMYVYAHMCAHLRALALKQAPRRL